MKKNLSTALYEKGREHQQTTQKHNQENKDDAHWKLLVRNVENQLEENPLCKQ